MTLASCRNQSGRGTNVYVICHFTKAGEGDVNKRNLLQDASVYGELMKFLPTTTNHTCKEQEKC